MEKDGIWKEMLPIKLKNRSNSIKREGMCGESRLNELSPNNIRISSKNSKNKDLEVKRKQTEILLTHFEKSTEPMKNKQLYQDNRRRRKQTNYSNRTYNENFLENKNNGKVFHIVSSNGDNKKMFTHANKISFIKLTNERWKNNTFNIIPIFKIKNIHMMVICLFLIICSYCMESSGEVVNMNVSYDTPMYKVDKTQFVYKEPSDRDSHVNEAYIIVNNKSFVKKYYHSGVGIFSVSAAFKNYSTKRNTDEMGKYSQKNIKSEINSLREKSIVKINFQFQKKSLKTRSSNRVEIPYFLDDAHGKHNHTEKLDKDRVIGLNSSTTLVYVNSRNNRWNRRNNTNLEINSNSPFKLYNKSVKTNYKTGTLSLAAPAPKMLADDSSLYTHLLLPYNEIARSDADHFFDRYNQLFRPSLVPVSIIILYNKLCKKIPLLLSMQPALQTFFGTGEYYNLI